MKLYKFIFLFLSFVLFTAVPPLALQFTGYSNLLVAGFWPMFFFVSFLTLLVTVFVLLAYAKNNGVYAQAFLGATTFKMLACLIFVLVFIKKNHPEKVIFVADFMYLYLLNIAFEIFGLLRTFRIQNLR